MSILDEKGAVIPLRRHVGVAMVAPEMMHTRTALSLCLMTSYQIGVKHDQITLNHHGGTVLSEARNKAATELLEQGCTHVLFVDSDMTFPMYALDRLLSHNVPVVAANCSRRVRPVSPTARRRNSHLSGETDPVYPDPDVTGLERVETVGTGFMLIRSDVFLQIEWPWFNQPWVEEHQKHVGEDVFFCGRLYEEDIPLYIDHDLSWHIGHIGSYTFTMQDVLDEKAAIDAGLWDGVKESA